MRNTILFSLLILAVCAADVQAQTALTGGRKVRFQDKDGTKSDKAVVAFAKDPALEVISPLCPAVTSLRISSSIEASSAFMPFCGKWSARGPGFVYRDKLASVGGIQKITYKAGKLVAKMKGANTGLLHGPVDYIEARFSVGASAFCGRFENFTTNDFDRLSAKKPSVACVEVCGDGILDFSEDCDDGNTTNGDGCDSNCTATACGNGVVGPGEVCDDGNVAGGDGCRSDCTVEACGDGILDPGEGCDDGNLDAGDCCDALCEDENGMPCSDVDNCTTGDVCVGSVCTGELTLPWINEYDYDDFTLGGVTDIDEFIEIAGPAGTDLSGYQIIAVEGNDTCIHTFTPGVVTGGANVSVVIPPGAVLGDDTGTGVGLYVVCFTDTSDSHDVAGECDVVLPGPDALSNLKNGDLVNADPVTCPDGILLLDPSNNLADAISYEGIVPNVGDYGSYFHVTPYNGGQDQGWKSRVSFEKTTGVLRATSGAEWQLSGGCINAAQNEVGCIEFSDSPGLVNTGQSLNCDEVFCGDEIVTGAEECDEGAANSDDPDATCRVNCTMQSCGDGIIDPGFGENCELQSDCGPGLACDGCNCVVGTYLGPLTYTVVPGPSELGPVDDGESSWLHISAIAPGISSGSQGDFNEGPLQLVAGVAGVDGIADLELAAPAYVGAQLPALAGAGKVCFRLEQDPSAMGFVDCDGGSSALVSLTMNSNAAGANDPPVLVVGGGGDSGPGAAIIRVLITGAQTSNPMLDCALADYSAGPTNATGLTTATATSRINNPLQGGAFTQVSLAGQPFDCGNWTTDSGASVVLPNTNTDVEVIVLGTYDFAQCLRLNDD